jgi:hypothetical protein
MGASSFGYRHIPLCDMLPEILERAFFQHLYLGTIFPMPYAVLPDDPMEPKLQYRGMTEQQVLAARADKDPQNLIALELGRLLFQYCKYVQDHIDAHGYTPQISDFFYSPARWPIEKVAKEMAQALITKQVSTSP